VPPCRRMPGRCPGLHCHNHIGRAGECQERLGPAFNPQVAGRPCQVAKAWAWHRRHSCFRGGARRSAGELKRPVWLVFGGGSAIRHSWPGFTYLRRAVPDTLNGKPSGSAGAGGAWRNARFSSSAWRFWPAWRVSGSPRGGASGTPCSRPRKGGAAGPRRVMRGGQSGAYCSSSQRPPLCGERSNHEEESGVGNVTFRLVLSPLHLGGKVDRPEEAPTGCGLTDQRPSGVRRAPEGTPWPPGNGESVSRPAGTPACAAPGDRRPTWRPGACAGVRGT